MPLNTIIQSIPGDGFLRIESSGEVHNEAELKEHCTIIFDIILNQDADKIMIYEPGTIFPRNKLLYYSLVNFYKEKLPKDIQHLKIAVVIAETFKEIGRFWETVCVNQGLQYFVFTNYEEAHAWLMKD